LVYILSIFQECDIIQGDIKEVNQYIRNVEGKIWQFLREKKFWQSFWESLANGEVVFTLRIGCVV
jgi:hypothetical protein